MLAKLQLMNSYIGLMVVYSATALPFTVWQMKGYYDTIPRELEEAAMLDGCEPLHDLLQSNFTFGGARSCNHSTFFVYYSLE